MNTTMAKVATKSPLIFSLVAIAGVIGTGICAARGYKRHLELMDEAIKKHEEEQADKKEEEKTDIWPEKKVERIIEKAKVCWSAWIPTAAVGASTIAAIVLAHKVSAAQIAAWSAAAAFGSKKLADQKDKLRRLIGYKNMEKFENFVTGKKMDRLEDSDDGMVAVHEQFTDVTFWIKPEDTDQIVQAFYDTEEELAKHGRVTFDFFANKVHLPKDIAYSQYAWTASKLVEEKDHAWIGFKLEERKTDNGKLYFNITYPTDPTTYGADVSEALVPDSEFLEDSRKLLEAQPELAV